MCMFSSYVPWVASTSIFARTTDRGTQLLAYSMSFAAVGELAMILPLPVAKGTGEDAARFIDFSPYPSLFDHLERGFPEPRSASRSLSFAPQAAKLVVHDVGDFEASYVPTIADFGRLDERFRLPHELWGRLPVYADYGFAVFKLKGSAAADASGETAETKKKIHPMVLEFPTRSPERTFFPTLHVHDGEVHPGAGFDHALYVQGSRTAPSSSEWRESLGPALAFVDVARTQSLVLGDELVHRREVRGSFANADVWVER
jgi:hypothetical protein